MAGISRFHNSFATTTRPLPLRRRTPGGSGSGSACRYGNPTFWIGVSMFCLVIVYVLIVIAVTRMHTITMHQHQHHIVKNNAAAAAAAASGAGAWVRRTSTTTAQQEDPTTTKNLTAAVVYDENKQQQTEKPYSQMTDEEKAKVDAKERREQERLHNLAIRRAHQEAEEAKKVAAAQADNNNSTQQQGSGNNQTKKEKWWQKRRRKKSPYRIFHLEDAFGKGVDPQDLVGAASSASADVSPPEYFLPPVNKKRDIQLKAFLEKPNFDEWDIKPLPIRQHAKADELTPITYPRLNACSRLPEQFPVDDTPSNEDPFLPWIHDVFPSADGRFIQFIAQNKRRCRTGSKETAILLKMQPQVALFQHVPVQRVTGGDGGGSSNETRYRLVDYKDADPDGITTRFICRFKPSMVETLSVHNLDYDWIAYRKGYRVSFLRDDGGIKSIHTTQLLFKCPVPPELQEIVRTGTSVIDDWATLFVDVIPIRTPPRYGTPRRYLAPWYREFLAENKSVIFRPKEEWGDAHILPKIEDSGRWENIPICLPSLMQYENQTKEQLPATQNDPIPKEHKLVSCIWASSGYTTRGNRFAVNDGQRRLLEWITHNRNIGFDHFYVYDNSGAYRNDTSLKPIADLFPDEVTWVNWPSQICNNNPNNVDSVGERSSQYAAESSCRLRFGAHVEWIGQFDVDEYLIPMGEHNTALSILEKLDKEDTRIISFGSWRAWPRWSLINPIQPIKDKHICWSHLPCFHLTIPLNRTLLQGYNCDRQPPGKKSQQMPAEKQIYRADYVTQHFVHYSSATILSALNRSEYTKQGFSWWWRGFPDKRQRFANEVHEGLMLHTKAVAHQDTSGWERVCHINHLGMPKGQQGLCRLGVPWPRHGNPTGANATPEGWAYNCYINEKVEQYHVPRLEEAMRKYDFLTNPP